MLERLAKWYLQRKMKKDNMYNYELVISTKEVTLRNRLSEYINTKIGSLKQSYSEYSNYKMFEWVTSGDIDNDKATLKELNKKLIEECVEVSEALHHLENEVNTENVRHALEEVLDVEQVLVALKRKIRLITKENEIKYTYRQAIDEHNLKAIERGWKLGGVYNVQFREED